MAFNHRIGITSGVCRDCSELPDSTGNCGCVGNPEVNYETLMQQTPSGTFTSSDAAHVASSYAKKKAANAPRDIESGLEGGSMKLGGRVIGQATRSQISEQKGLGMSGVKVSKKSARKAERKSRIQGL